MYKQFFGLRENPFSVNPDPRYLFLTSQTRDAWDTLVYGIETHKGLILLTGEVGTGKTTLINRLLDWLRQQQTPTAFIFNSHLETRHLFDFILADFGVSFDPRTRGNQLLLLNEWLLERYRANQNSVLIVDEAQGLSFDLLEEIRLLLNLETPHEKLLQVVLVGQPELEGTLKRYELRQLRQRIALRCKTAPLTREETRAYLQARLRIAGSDGRQVFAPEAVNALHFYSRGVPRVINLLCEHSLINSYAGNLRPVPANIVEEVARELQFDDGRRPFSPADCGDTACTHSIFVKSTVADISSLPLPVTEPSWEVQCAAGLSSPAAPFPVAKPTTLPNFESGTKLSPSENNSAGMASTDALQRETERVLNSTEFTAEDAFRLLSELALKSGSIAPARSLQVAESRSDFDLSAASQRSLPSQPETSDFRQIPNSATAQTLQGPGERRVRKSRAWPVHLNTWWAKCWSSIASSPGLTQIISSLLRRIKPAVNPLPWMHRRWPAWRDEFSSMVKSTALPGMTASLIRWLRQPWGPMPGDLRHARAIHARGQSGHTRF